MGESSFVQGNILRLEAQNVLKLFFKRGTCVFLKKISEKIHKSQATKKSSNFNSLPLSYLLILMPFTRLRIFLHDNAGIMTTKPEGIAQGCIHRTFLRFIK